MHFPWLKMLSLCALFIAPTSSAVAQEGAPLLVPPVEKMQISVGAQGGWMKNTQSGSFQSNCGCTFENGKGNSGTGSVFIELGAIDNISLGINFGFDYNSISSSVLVNDTATLTFSNNSEVTSGRFAFLRNTSANASYIFAAPYVKVSPLGLGFYIKASPEFGYLTNSNFTESRELQNSKIIIISQMGDTVILDKVRFQNGGSSETLQDSLISDAKSLRVSILLSAGYDVPITKNLSLFPEVTYDLPLTNVSSSPKASNWKVSSYSFNLGMKYIFE
jgi:hypothetical protein